MTIEPGEWLSAEEMSSIRAGAALEAEREIVRKAQDRMVRKQQEAYFKRVSQGEMWPETEAAMLDWVDTRATAYIRERTGNQEALFDTQTDGAAIRALCLYFIQSPEFETLQPGYSLKKGLLLNGVTGCGKTMLLRLLQRNPKCSYMVLDARKLADDYARKGSEVIARYSTHLSTNVISSLWPGATEYGLCVDDLGTENLGSNFGNKRNVLLDILLNRYERVPFHQTLITTNFKKKQMVEHYGERLQSRIEEMFNVVIFNARFDHRTKQIIPKA